MCADGALNRSRSTKRVRDLAEQIGTGKLTGSTGIAHTRWATHGAPASNNAHPHFSPNEASPRIALAHNGIIENHELLRTELRDQGYTFHSETDSEVIAHLIDSLYRGDLRTAVRAAVARLRGTYAIAVCCRDEPSRVIGARDGSPLVVGIGDGEHFLASDALALAGTANRICYLEDGDLVDIQLSGWEVENRDGERVERSVRTLDTRVASTELGPYRHFMQKEIFEQPKAVELTIGDLASISPDIFGPNAAQIFAEIDSVLILACGTSFHAGLTAKNWLEAVAGIPTQVEVASEYRYRTSVPSARTLVVAISQSGETADTLGAVRHARELGMGKTLAICNVATSALARDCELAFVTQAGPEVGVASTKAFTTQLTALFLLALSLAKVRGRLGETEERLHVAALRALPKALEAALALEPEMIAWAQIFACKDHMLYLGRGLHFPIAAEGALKLKEISYIHAEAYPAGELKHGPLALVSKEMPVVVIAPTDALLAKIKSNLAEVRARAGALYVLTDADAEVECAEGIMAVRLPAIYGLLSPIVYTIPLQLLAYHTAVMRGTDIDKPRNLAKSVTVE
jgi:glucosamine--fructose-6-phosphate aminotransferase (isomerizing)